MVSIYVTGVVCKLNVSETAFTVIFISYTAGLYG
jgi:hypothetical protein